MKLSKNILLTLVGSICLLFCSLARSEEVNIDQSITKGLSDTTVNLLKLLYNKTPENKNIIFSSFNVYSALALVHLGSSGETQQQIAKYLGVNDVKSTQKIHEAISSLIKTVENTTEIRSFGPKGAKNEKAATIETGNGIFVQKGLSLKETYVTDVKNYYQSSVDEVDYAKEAQKATDTINEFVSKETRGLIPKVFSETLPSDTLIVLTACLYFKATWSETFSEASTSLEDFNAAEGAVKVNMMQHREVVPYIKDPTLNIEAIGLSYEGNDASMYFILPQQNQDVKTVINQLKPEDISRIVNGATSTNVNYKIPRTEFEWSSDIVPQLQALGIARLFQPNAQLDFVSKTGPLSVDQITHSAKIKINENGTEAAAVTAIKITRLSYIQRPNPIDFVLNKPFIFFIYHHNTKSVLFLGSVANPNTEK